MPVKKPIVRPQTSGGGGNLSPVFGDRGHGAAFKWSTYLPAERSDLSANHYFFFLFTMVVFLFLVTRCRFSDHGGTFSSNRLGGKQIGSMRQRSGQMGVVMFVLLLYR